MIKLIKSTFYHEKEMKDALAQFVLEAEILSMGEQCKNFERSFAKKQGRKYAAFVTNGSVANLLLIQSMMNLGHLKKGDKVGFSALTWPTNVMPIIQLGLDPVAVDCELSTLNVSPTKLKEKIAGLKCLFITNVLGFCDDLPEIKKICEDENIILMEDNCESLGSKVNGELLGNFGLASTFSFFVGHHMSTIEGGMVCTDDEGLYESLLMGRAHGWDRNLSENSQQKLRQGSGVDDFYAKYTFYDLASNYRPTEINGFIGNAQVQYWDEIVSKRESNFKKFQSAMKDNEDFHQFELDHMDIISNFSMPIICKDADVAKKFRGKFDEIGAEIRPVIAGNMTKQPFYKKYVSDSSELPNSDLVHSNGFYFGNNPELTDSEVSELCSLINC